MAPGRNIRHTTRGQLPYARPTKQTTSSWSISGLFGFLNPFTKSSDQVDSDGSTSDADQDSPPPQSSFRNDSEVEQEVHSQWEHPQQLPPCLSLTVQPPSQSIQQVTPQQVPQSPSRNPLPLPLVSPQSSPTSGCGSSSSLAKNLEPVTRFLVEKAGQPLNDFEAAGIVDYIQRNVQGTDKPELFRFSTSPSRGSSPGIGLSSQGQDSSSTSAPRKTLTSNPNGIYRWQGAGSSRPRNRYQSPGFGPRPPQSRIKLSPPKMPVVTDTKRRRVGDEAESSVFQRASIPSTSGSTSAVSPLTSTSNTTSQPSHLSVDASMTLSKGKSSTASMPTTNGGPASRMRTTGTSTTPAVPSPLRQAWKGNDAPPQPSRSTRAADFMTELIKEVTPTKKPDVSNPYQTASPVQPLPRRPVTRRQRPAIKPPDQPKAKEPELTALEIIEATVPKGSKRSRPPPELEKLQRTEEIEQHVPVVNMCSGCFSSSTITSTDVEETMNMDEESPSKKRKAGNIFPPKSLASTVGIINVDATDLSSSLVIRPSEIVEPEELPKMNGKSTMPATTAFSSPGTTKALFGAKSSAPKEPSKLRYSYQADKMEVDLQAATAVPPLVPVTPSPSVTQASPAAVTTPRASSPRSEARALGVHELPKYTFTVKETVCLAGSSFETPRSAALAAPVSTLPVFDIVAIPASTKVAFDWAAVTLKPPSTSGGQWVCDLCQLNNPDSAKEKCTICDAPRPGSVSAAPSSGNITAPEISAPPTSIPAPAPTPASASAPTPQFKPFDWTAAKIKPSTKSDDSWTCSLCSLSNPGTITEKCSICQHPR